MNGSAEADSLMRRARIKVQDMKTQELLLDDTLDSFSEISRPGEEAILDAMSRATKSLLDNLAEKLAVLEKE